MIVQILSLSCPSTHTAHAPNLEDLLVKTLGEFVMSHHASEDLVYLRGYESIYVLA